MKKKEDEGKLKFSLIPIKPLQEVIKVRMFGDAKYGFDNWKLHEKPEELYPDAIARHLMAYMSGQKYDDESGYHHLAHVIANCLFMIWFDFRQEEKT